LALGIDAYPPGSAKLTGTAFSRLRVGALRIVYLVDADQSIVVLRAAWRWERTYRRVDR
jgi:mRNA-degrading endonuclease RelE of RelBE toxin-antitoxin system